MKKIFLFLILIISNFSISFSFVSRSARTTRLTRPKKHKVKHTGESIDNIDMHMYKFYYAPTNRKYGAGYWRAGKFYPSHWYGFGWYRHQPHPLQDTYNYKFDRYYLIDPVGFQRGYGWHGEITGYHGRMGRLY